MAGPERRNRTMAQVTEATEAKMDAMFDILPVSHLIKIVSSAAECTMDNTPAKISLLYGLRALARKLDKQSFEAVCQQIA